jgi:hypothetical protein
MNKTQRNVALRRSTKLSQVEIETMQRRHVEQFCVLAAIIELLPRSEDTKGRATGTLRVAELTARAGVSGKAVDRSLGHWRRWRVLWLFWKGDHVWHVRFERAVVETLLATRTTSPGQVGRLLTEHRRHREAVAPRRPKLVTELVQ